MSAAVVPRVCPVCYTDEEYSADDQKFPVHVHNVTFKVFRENYRNYGFQKTTGCRSARRANEFSQCHYVQQQQQQQQQQVIISMNLILMLFGD